MEQRNEPSTEEIVWALRFKSSTMGAHCGSDCEGCPCDALRQYGDDSCDWGTDLIAADRLESLTQEIEELKAFAEESRNLCKLCASEGSIEQKAEVDALTARAESAEAREKAAIDVIEQIGRITFPTNFSARSADNRICIFESKIANIVQSTIKEWRGQPQEG